MAATPPTSPRCSRTAAAARPRRLPRRRHEPQRPGARPTGSSSTSAATCAGSTVEDEGARVRVKPGTVLGDANRVLAPYGRRLGPDPASTDIACVGGVIANNSGGMRCGVDARLLLDGQRAHLRAALGDGDRHRRARRRASASPPPSPSWRRACSRSATRSSPTPSSRARIRRKFEIKNTTGYRLCAFLDAETPVEIFRRLLVGSRGHARLHRRGRVRDRPRTAADDGLLGPLPRRRRGDRAGPATSSPRAPARSS